MSDNDQPPNNQQEGVVWNNDQENDRLSFEDSDRFSEGSLCSWSSEQESLCNNWRGWKKPNVNINVSFGSNVPKRAPDDVISLTELAARCVASFIPFELVEHVFPPVPEQLQLRIAYWSFPDNEEDIRLYSCLANSSADEFHRGEQLFKNKCVKDPLQIGFHLSATVSTSQPKNQFNVAVTFDRRRISSCNCTCTSSAYWCSHVVAVCLFRIHCVSSTYNAINNLFAMCLTIKYLNSFLFVANKSEFACTSIGVTNTIAAGSAAKVCTVFDK